MKHLFLIILSCFLITSCKGQVDSIEHKMINELSIRNTALKNNDFKTLYKYLHPIDLNGVSLEEFDAGNKETIRTLYKGVKFSDFEILDVGKIQHCNNQYQCFILMKTHPTKYDKPEEPFESNVIALSDDGNQWLFINVGKQDISEAQTRYPFVCLK